MQENDFFNLVHTKIVNKIIYFFWIVKSSNLLSYLLIYFIKFIFIIWWKLLVKCPSTTLQKWTKCSFWLYFFNNYHITINVLAENRVATLPDFSRFLKPLFLPGNFYKSNSRYTKWMMSSKNYWLLYSGTVATLWKMLAIIL